MPRIVDHDQRRAEIGDAVLRLIARYGVEAVTVREVARESGWSTGVLAHYFHGKDEMLAFAYQACGDAFRRRVEALPSDAGVMRWLEGALEALLPLDESRRDEIVVWFGFVGRVLANEMLVAFPQRAYRELAELLADVLAQGQASGEVRPDLDPAVEARSLVAFCDGLGMQHVFDPEHVDRASLRRALAARLAPLRPPATRPASEADAESARTHR